MSKENELKFHQNLKDDKVYWAISQEGRTLFSFDKEKVYDLYIDYPDKLSQDQIQLVNNSDPEVPKIYEFRKKFGLLTNKIEKPKVIWIKDKNDIGKKLFTFDNKKIYNLFQDYPYNLTNEEKRIFDIENPYWAYFFRERK